MRQGIHFIRATLFFKGSKGNFQEVALFVRSLSCYKRLKTCNPICDNLARSRFLLLKSEQLESNKTSVSHGQPTEDIGSPLKCIYPSVAEEGLMDI
jgi:hypothetical protein